MILFAFFLYCFFKLLSPFAPFTYTLHFQHPEKDYSPLEVVSPSKCSSIYLAVSSFSKGCILSLRQKHRGTTYSFFFFSFFFFFLPLNTNRTMFSGSLGAKQQLLAKSGYCWKQSSFFSSLKSKRSTCRLQSSKQAAVAIKTTSCSTHLLSLWDLQLLKRLL